MRHKSAPSGAGASVHSKSLVADGALPAGKPACTSAGPPDLYAVLARVLDIFRVDGVLRQVCQTINGFAAPEWRGTLHSQLHS